MVVVVGLTVTAVPVVAGRLPGVMTPVPPAKTPVRVVLDPSVMVAAEVVKLVIVATGVTGAEAEEPPQPLKPATARLRAAAHEAKTRNCLMNISSANEILELNCATIIRLGGGDLSIVFKGRRIVSSD